MCNPAPRPKARFKATFLVLFMNIATALGFSATALAGAPSFSGTYVLDSMASDDVFQAMEPVISQMNVVKRIAARHILKSRVVPELRMIRIDQSASGITVLEEGRPYMSVPGDGREVDHRTERGKMVKLSGLLGDSVFQAKMVGEKGIYQAHSSLSPDADRIDVHVKLDLKEHAKPVTFKLVYTRQAG